MHNSSAEPLFTGAQLKKLIVPLVVEQLLAVTVGMADTIMITSRGEAYVSGISLVDSISFLLINLLSALCTGGAVIAAQVSWAARLQKRPRQRRAAGFYRCRAWPASGAAGRHPQQVYPASHLRLH